MTKSSEVYDKLREIIYAKTGDSRTTAGALAPLGWYMNSGRMSLEFEERLCSRTEPQLDRLADRLIKNAFSSHEKAIKSVKQCLGIRGIRTF